MLERIGIQVPRKSMDKKKNNNGFKLIDICKIFLTILNGRYGNDKNVGQMTFRGLSVIDYVISSYKGLQILSNFKIIELDRLFSDGHSLLSFSFKLDIIRKGQLKQKTQLHRNRPKWAQKDAGKFAENINKQKITEVVQKLQYQRDTDFTQDFIDSVVKEIAEIFNESANKTFSGSHSWTPTCSTDTKNKPWFGPTCNSARKFYHSARKKYNRARTNANRQSLKLASRKYKITMNKFIKQFNFRNGKKNT